MRVSKGSKIHYHMFHATMEAKSMSACGRVVSTKIVALKIEDVTCKACLRSLWALGSKAKKRLNKIVPPYMRIPF